MWTTKSRAPETSAHASDIPFWGRACIYSTHDQCVVSGTRARAADKKYELKFWKMPPQLLSPLEEIAQLGQHTDIITACDVSPDGRYFVSASYNILKLWDRATKAKIEGTRLQGKFKEEHRGWIRDCRFSADSRYIVSAGMDKTVKIWSVETGKVLQTLQHDAPVLTCGFTKLLRPGALSSVITGDAEGAISRWEPASTGTSFTMKEKLAAHSAAVNHLTFSQCGNYMASASSDQRIIIWHRIPGMPAWNQAKIFPTDNVVVNCCAFFPTSPARASYQGTPTPPCLVAGCDGGMVKVWNTTTAVSQVLESRSKHVFPVTAVCYSDDGQYIFSESFHDKKIIVWDSLVDITPSLPLTPTRPVARALGLSSPPTPAHDEPPSPFTHQQTASPQLFKSPSRPISLGSPLLLLPPPELLLPNPLSSPGPLTPPTNSIFDGPIAPPTEFRSEAPRTELFPSPVSPPGSPRGRAEASSSPPVVTPVASPSRTTLRTPVRTPLRPSGKNFVSCTPPDRVEYPTETQLGAPRNLGTTFAMMATSRSVAAPTFTPLPMITAHTARVTSCDIVAALDSSTPEDYLIVSGSEDNTAKISSLLTRKCLRIMKNHTATISSVAFSPNGKWTVTGSLDKTLRLRETKESFLSTTQAITGTYGKPVTACSIAPDNNQIVFGASNEMRIWDITAKAITILKGHTDTITSACFSPRGNFILSTARDNTLRIWQPNGTLVRTLTGHTAAVNAGAWSMDQRYFASASSDRTLKIYKADDGSEYNTLSGHGGAVTACVFTADGEFVISGNIDQRVKIWRVHTGECLETLIHPDSLTPINCLALSGDNRYLVAGGDNGNINVWNLEWGAASSEA